MTSWNARNIRVFLPVTTTCHSKNVNIPTVVFQLYTTASRRDVDWVLNVAWVDQYEMCRHLTWFVLEVNWSFTKRIRFLEMSELPTNYLFLPQKSWFTSFYLWFISKKFQISSAKSAAIEHCIQSLQVQHSNSSTHCLIIFSENVAELQG